MKIPKEEAGFWNWGSSSKPKLNRESVNGGSEDNEAHCERRYSKSYRRVSIDRFDRDQREQHREQRDHRENSNRREKESSNVQREQQHASSTNNRDREREREKGSDIIKNKNSRSMRYNPGPLTRNPYLNFMREFRKNNTGENILDITKHGARAWQSLTSKEKEDFAIQARRVPPKSFKKKKKHMRRGFY